MDSNFTANIGPVTVQKESQTSFSTNPVSQISNWLVYFTKSQCTFLLFFYRSFVRFLMLWSRKMTGFSSITSLSSVLLQSRHGRVIIIDLAFMVGRETRSSNQYKTLNKKWMFIYRLCDTSTFTFPYQRVCLKMLHELCLPWLWNNRHHMSTHSLMFAKHRTIAASVCLGITLSTIFMMQELKTYRATCPLQFTVLFYQIMIQSWSI